MSKYAVLALWLLLWPTNGTADALFQTALTIQLQGNFEAAPSCDFPDAYTQTFQFTVVNGYAVLDQDGSSDRNVGVCDASGHRSSGPDRDLRLRPAEPYQSGDAGRRAGQRNLGL